MMRSLFSGVSGLRNHQIQMDVIGNNIANVNTIGYKASRVTFEESLSQALKVGTRPQNSKGGINPMYVGIGMDIGSIDKIFSQGNLQRTGSKLDLAIQGDAFFVLSNGKQDFFTRAGNFQVDSNGNLVFGNTGMRVQGRMADAVGNVHTETEISEIKLPFGQKAPAKATTEIGFTGNLDADTDKVAQVLSSSFAKTAEVVSDNAFPSGGITVTTGSNDELEITVDDDTGGTITETLTLTSSASGYTYSSLSELVAEINKQIEASRYLSGEVVAEIKRDGSDSYLSIHTVDKGGTNTELTLGGTFAGTGSPLNLSTTRVTGTDENTALVDLPFFKSVLTDGDIIRISGSDQDGYSISREYVYTAPAPGDPEPTVADLMAAMDEALPGSTVSINPDGTIRVTDAVSGESKTSVNLTLKDKETASVLSIPSFSVLTRGRDAGTHTTTILVYDSKGKPHTVEIGFTNISSEEEPDLWRWEVTIDNGEITPSAGSRGVIKFNPNGSLASFEISDGSPLMFEPGSGAATMQINLNAGSAGYFNGITQFRNPTTTVASSQDGYGMGDLYDFSFDDTGTITGHFTNGVSQVIAQVAVATFNNPTGLEQVGENMFTMGGNSGMAVKGWAGETIRAKIAAGHLEMSNVDLAQEFTNLIVAQRGFQANARVITTSDTLLEEIVRLKR